MEVSKSCVRISQIGERFHFEVKLSYNKPHWLEQASLWLDGPAGPQEQEQLAVSIRGASESELEVLSDLILNKLDDSDTHGRARFLLQQLASRLVSDSSNREQALDVSIIAPETLVQIYDQLSETDQAAAAHGLQCLAAQADVDSLNALADVLVENPPVSWQNVGIAISPLWRTKGPALSQFFGRLESALIQPSTLVVLLDLANHAVRSHRVASHPWKNKQPQLDSLLGQVVVRLERLQSDPSQFGDSVQAVQNVLADSVALSVSLCDTLGLIGDTSSSGALEAAMDLSHRRIQAEAAFALARFGDEKGIARLVALAADPVTRSRVVQYADELELSGAIDEKYRFPQALAESELAAWLASPEQYSIPPSRIEHVDTRTLYWPGYDEPRDCFLFQFQYQLPQGAYTNVGIVGPLTRAFACDLTGLSVDDQFAAFAGWHVEHEEIYEVPANQLNSPQSQEVERLKEHYRLANFEVESTIALTFLLGEPALLAIVRQEGKSYFGITDASESVCFPKSDQPNSITPELVLAVYRGRKLLKAFN
jgi:HEAT repeat protein